MTATPTAAVFPPGGHSLIMASAGRLARLTEVSRAVAALCRVPHAPAQPYAGAAAFAHKGGLHVAALAKMPASYNHVPPERVGNAHRSVVS